MTKGHIQEDKDSIEEFLLPEIKNTEEAELALWRNALNMEMKQEEEDDTFDINVTEEFLNAQKAIDTDGQKNVNEQDDLLNSEMPHSSSPVPSHEPINIASEGENRESSYIEDRKGGMDESDDSSEADEEESKRLEERRKEWRVDDRRCSASSSSSSSSGKVILKRTVNQNVVVRQRSRVAERMPSPGRGSTYRPRRSPSPYYSSGRMRSRSRSPINVDLHDTGRRGRSSQYHYDDPRRELKREESYSCRLQQTQIAEPASQTKKMADRYETNGSPLEGAKVVVTNLQNSVTKSDIVELFGDVGALKQAKVASPGSAEVVFVNRSDAQKAVVIYHNRQLDGKAMKCQMVGGGGDGSSRELELELQAAEWRWLPWER